MIEAVISESRLIASKSSRRVKPSGAASFHWPCCATGFIFKVERVKVSPKPEGFFITSSAWKLVASGCPLGPIAFGPGVTVRNQ